MSKNVKIVIDIPVIVYAQIKAIQNGSLGCKMILDRVKNGIILPENHGDLKDIDKIISDGISKGFCDWYDEMKYADTIIETDED